MARLTTLAARAVPLLAALAAMHPGAAVAAGKDGERPVSNTFAMIVAPPPPAAPSGSRSNGVGIAPSKPVVSNPYHVPLLQNAGSLRSTR